ncbi:hypothetical protein ACQR1W_17575 [Bradyrhizobium sp. HKCCYLS1011]|uniref:hypothetical protein n=1 Tax=Bradyrhizobium sp. HKCCYLS1011 TaxID=3420733 RepID=UPI003EBC4F83
MIGRSQKGWIEVPYAGDRREPLPHDLETRAASIWSMPFKAWLQVGAHISIAIPSRPASSNGTPMIFANGRAWAHELRHLMSLDHVEIGCADERQAALRSNLMTKD